MSGLLTNRAVSKANERCVPTWRGRGGGESDSGFG